MTEPTPPLRSLEPASEAAAPRVVSVGDIHWPSVLEFFHLFKGFRLAINPAKLLIGVAALLLIYLSGCLFDLAWGPQVIGDELQQYRSMTADSYYRLQESRQKSRGIEMEGLLADALAGASAPMSLEERATLAQSPRSAYWALRRVYIDEFHKREAELAQERTEPQTKWGGLIDSKTPKEREQEGRMDAANRLESQVKEAQLARGTGIVKAFAEFELDQFGLLLDNTLCLIRVSPVHSGKIDSDLERANENAVSLGAVSKESWGFWRSDTVVGCLGNMSITGPSWLFSATAPVQWRPENADTWRGWVKMWVYRLVYLVSVVLLAAFWFVVLALAGALMCRLSALEFAGHDKTPLIQVFRFSVKKILPFIKAPLMPFAILLVIGILLAVVALAGAIPFLGEIVIGLLFVVFLIVGFIMMLLTLGILGGMQLFYPTIAVEGSDSFDAMSRSFAYVYARPWRLIFYSLVSLIYGAITFLFITFCAYLLLALTHFFLGWGMNLFGAVHGWYSGADKLDTLWPMPRWGHLWTEANWAAMSWTEALGAAALHCWLFVLLCGVGAYVLSFYHSSNTIIYLLLRRSVDGQALTEVYEQPAETITPSAPAPPAPQADAPAV